MGGERAKVGEGRLDWLLEGSALAAYLHVRCVLIIALVSWFGKLIDRFEYGVERTVAKELTEAT